MTPPLPIPTHTVIDSPARTTAQISTSPARADPSCAALHTVLSDLLRAHAPGAVLLARVGEAVLRLEGETLELGGAQLEPPEAWLESGEMTWLARDGELLGLLWSETGAASPTAVEVLTMLLAASRPDGAGREAEVLVTQLPVATAWLTPELVFRRVSRPFLELLNLSDAGLLGRAVDEVLPGRPALLLALEQVVAGRSVRLGDECLGARPGSNEWVRWVRGEARPYLGGWGAGVLLTLQDVSGEYERAARVAALLDTRTPAALLSADGVVLHASPGLSELAPQTPTQAASPLSPALVGAPLWTWSGLAETSSQTVRELVRQASKGGAAQADVKLVGGETLSLTVRRSGASGLLVAESLGTPPGGPAPLELIAQVMALSDDAAVLLDASGRAQLISDRAAALLGVEAARLVGLGLSRVLGELGVRVFTPQGEPLALPEWHALRLPLRREVLLALPGHALRHMELRATCPVPDAGGRAGAPAGSLLLTLRDVTVLRRAAAKMHHDARHDPLTGLLNRAGLRGDLAARAADPARAGALLCLNIDGFGDLNAGLGRVACDRVLIGLAARLNDLACAHGGGAARLQGGTFAAWLPGLSPQLALDTARQLLDPPLRAGPREVPLTLALGAAALGEVALEGAGAAGETRAEDALSDAELAAQHARQQGRAASSVFAPALRARVRSAYALEEDLRGALAAGAFTLLYQPVLDLKTGQPRGAEALLRWRHPERGLLPPGDFLEAAGRSDLITRIGEWVVEEAVAGRGRLRAACGPGPGEGQGGLRVSVNLSLEELRRSAGLKCLLPLLRAEGAPDIEVAAGSLLDHSFQTLDLLEQLRACGARLCVDDFGDGPGSLAALTRFPLSAVKLHPTLTARLPGDPRSVTLVQATTDLAHRLGLGVVAVGVESAEQLALLRDLGCDAAQGHAICPPLPEAELVRWLLDRRDS